MADDLLTASDADLDGVVLNPTTGTGGNDFTFTNQGNTILYVKNTSAGSLDIAFDAIGNNNKGVAYSDKTVTLTAGQEKIFSSFDTVALRSSGVTRIILPDGNETDIDCQVFNFISGK